VSEARVMSAAAEAANTVTACCFNWRYTPACQTARNAIRSGQIGAVRDLRTEGVLPRSQPILHRQSVEGADGHLQRSPGRRTVSRPR
jgi:predicted dehydrogenase